MPTQSQHLNHGGLTLKKSREIAGTVSTSNSKLNTPSWSLPVEKCNVGSKLRKKTNSVCSKCYADRMSKFRSNIYKSWNNNYELYIKSKESLEKRDQWIYAMTNLIKSADKKLNNPNHFRWFVGGDLPDSDMLDRISLIASMTPDIKHWIPTKEKRLAELFLEVNRFDIPKNMCIRLSTPMINPKTVHVFPNTSTTFSKGEGKYGFNCPSIGNKEIGCKSCGYKCWDRNVLNVTYKLH